MISRTPFRQMSLPVAQPLWPEPGHSWLEALLSSKVVLGGAIILSILAHTAARLASVPATGETDGFSHPDPSLVAELIALLLGHRGLARFSALPNLQPTTYVAPVFLLSYGSIFAFAWLFQTPLGLPFVVSACAVVAWYLVINTVKTRFTRRRIAIIGDDARSLAQLESGIEWYVPAVPRLAGPVSALVVSRSAQLSPAWQNLATEAVLRGVPVHDSRHMEEVLTGRVQLRHMLENSFGSLLPSLTYMHLKHAADFIVAAAALVFVVPTILAFSLLIRIESPGPALFRQERMGYRGRPFTCYKLRSMRANHNGPHFTLNEDDRVTRIGRFIRRYRIDELPQVFNILKGEMSWIGPRPEALQLAQLYEAAIPFYAYRHAVRPGISGWAAVHQGNVALVDAVSIKLGYDFFYLKYYSLWLDALIMFKTIKTVLTGFGSN